MLHPDAGTNLVWEGVYEWGSWDDAGRGGGPDRDDPGAPLRPLQLHPARVRRRARRVQPGHRAVDDLLQQPVPGLRGDHDGPRARARGLDKMRFVTQDIGGGFGNKITSHPQLVAICLLARKLNRAIQWTEWRTEFHLTMSHGNERWFQRDRDRGQERRHDARLPDEGARRRRRVHALRAARRRHLGAGHARRLPLEERPARLHAGRDEQGAVQPEPRLLAHAAPLVHRARDGHRRGELDLDPIEVRKRNYIRADEMPYTTPNGCVYDSGDYAGMLDMALGLLGRARPRTAPRPSARASCSASGSERRSTAARTTSPSRA